MNILKIFFKEINQSALSLIRAVDRNIFKDGLGLHTG